MKFVAIAALIATVSAMEGKPPTVGLGHAIIPQNREDYDNAKELWKGDWAKYRSAHPNDQDCSISESDNWKGAQQCSQSWECRGARMCERGGWCSGYDGCEGTPLPDQAPGLAPDF
jgi:hypothetical protein